jgi:hypothetical protein
MIEIVIFVLPSELDDLGNSLKRLQKSSEYLSEEQRMNIKFNVVMGISDEIIDWKSSTVTKKECIDKFFELIPLTSWSWGADFIPSTEINGCSSMRRIASYSDSTYYIWLDTDIIFDPVTLPHMLNAVKAVEYSYSEFVISPEIVRQWDSTWDCLVNDKFINKPIGYQATNNPQVDTVFQDGKLPTLVPIKNNALGQPYMKFAGGWFTLISSELLNRIPFPDGYSHYGYEDTYLMWGAQVLQDPKIIQFKLKNIVVCENYHDRYTSFDGMISFIDKREEYKKHNQSLMEIGLQNLVR